MAKKTPGRKKTQAKGVYESAADKRAAELQRALRQQERANKLAKQVLSARRRADESLERLRDFLNNQSAESFASAAERANSGAAASSGR